MLPEAFRIASIRRDRLDGRHNGVAVIDGVKIKLLEVLPPEGRSQI